MAKIHCDLLDIDGINWQNIKQEQIDCIISSIHSQELIEVNDELHGFVGTTDYQDAVGGYFIIQFPTEFLSYEKDKTTNLETITPVERVFFVLLIRSGRLLLQHRNFKILKIDMEAATTRVKTALSRVLINCKIGSVVSLSPAIIHVKRSELIEYYHSSKRVRRLKVNNPNPQQIPNDINYYNPQRDRNEILLDSRKNDYPKTKIIDIHAQDNADLRDTHLGKDLIYTVTESDPFIMEIDDSKGRPKVIRRTEKRSKLEFNLDTEKIELSKEALMRVLDILFKESLFETPISSPPSYNPTVQMPLFKLENFTNMEDGEEDDEEDNDLE